MKNWTNAIQSILSLFLASNCPLCDRPTSNTMCSDCFRQLQRCQRAKPNQFWQGSLPLFVWGRYGGTLKRAIASLKYDNHPELSQPLGEALGKAWINFPLSSQLKKMTVVPIPIHPNKLKTRGFNQAELIAKHFCYYTGLSLQPQGLERVRETEAQFGLGIQEREQNLAKAFTVGKVWQKRSPKSEILLLDDIYTTGATVRSAAEVLQRQGIKVAGIVAIASTKD
ncbi:MAG: ComF family protein [Chroococcales cyanobacterium]